MLNEFHILLFIFWIAYVVVHSLMAAAAFKNFVQRIAGGYFRYYRLAYSLFAFVTLALLLRYQWSGGSPSLFFAPVPIQIFAVVAASAGLIMMMACIGKYFANLSGIDVFINKPKRPVLEVQGLHQYVRHPLYLGTLVFIWGLFVLFPLFGNLLACLVITLYVLIGIRLEERKLELEFGDRYRTYAHKTPMLIPSIRFDYAKHGKSDRPGNQKPGQQE